MGKCSKVLHSIDFNCHWTNQRYSEVLYFKSKMQYFISFFVHAEPKIKPFDFKLVIISIN
jgi:hypothetical protein